MVIIIAVKHLEGNFWFKEGTCSTFSWGLNLAMALSAHAYCDGKESFKKHYFFHFKELLCNNICMNFL